MSHPLDNPVWHALGGPQFRLGATDGKVRHYDPTIAMFAAVGDPAAADVAGLPKGRSYGFVTVERVRFPASIEVEREAEVMQMIAERPSPDAPNEEVVALVDSNVPEMMTLAELTHPGPFAGRTIKMGTFWGVFVEGRLAAMAGERMRLDGFTEVSAVCTHPDFRGRGFARSLVSKVLAGVIERGETPFLHVYPDNRPAIAAYEKLGFTQRRTMRFTIVRPRWGQGKGGQTLQ